MPPLTIGTLDVPGCRGYSLSVCAESVKDSFNERLTLPEVRTGLETMGAGEQKCDSASILLTRLCPNY
jgi:hypothetical protein